MREVLHGRRAVLLAAVAMLTGNVVPGSVQGAAPGATIHAIPGCPEVSAKRRLPPDPGPAPARPTAGDNGSGTSSPVAVATPEMGATAPGLDWSDTIDQTGTLTGHVLRLGDSTWRAGPRAFVDGPFGNTLIVGDRSHGGTRLRLVDRARRCTTRTVDLRSLVYGSLLLDDGAIVVSLVDRRTRAELGVWRIGSLATDRPDASSRRRVAGRRPPCPAR